MSKENKCFPKSKVCDFEYIANRTVDAEASKKKGEKVYKEAEPTHVRVKQGTLETKITVEQFKEKYNLLGVK